jgi:acyl-CoA synthetase (AMP-forming)/AMP-acid ligase II
MAKKDEDGFYQIVDRKDNMIITGGEHVYPSEVEEVIGGHPCVFDTAVMSVPDDKWGEKVVAIVIPKADIDEKTLIDYCKDKLASFKRPKQILFIKPEEMPRTPTGKILHRVLREKYS